MKYQEMKVLLSLLMAIQETPEDDNVEVLFFGIQSCKCMLSFSKNSVFLN